MLKHIFSSIVINEILGKSDISVIIVSKWYHIPYTKSSIIKKWEFSLHGKPRYVGVTAKQRLLSSLEESTPSY